MFSLKSFFKKAAPSTPPATAELPIAFSCPECNEKVKVAEKAAADLGLSKLLIYYKGHAYLVFFNPPQIEQAEKVLRYHVSSGNIPAVAAGYGIRVCHQMAQTGERTASIFCFDPNEGMLKV